MPEGVNYPAPQPGPEVTDQVGPPAVQEGAMMESTSPVQGIQQGYGTLAPDEQQELMAFVTPRFAELLIKMMGPEIEPMVAPYLQDDLMGVPEIGVEGATGMAGVPEMMPPAGAVIDNSGAGGGGTPADDIAGIYGQPKPGQPGAY